MPFAWTQATKTDRRGRFTLSLRIRLLLVVVSALVPLVGLDAVQQYRQYQVDRDQVCDQLLTLARGTAASVEHNLQQRISMLETLALAPSLQSGDLDQFGLQANAFLSRQPPGTELGVATPDLQQQRVYGIRHDRPDTPPDMTASARTRQMLKGGHPSIGDLQASPSGSSAGFRVNVPVQRDGHVIHNLFLTLASDVMIDSLMGEWLPPQAVLSIADTTGAIVAGSPNLNRYVGGQVVPELWRAIQSQPEGVARTAVAEGIPATVAFAHVRLSGWSIAVVIPEKALFAPLRTMIIRSATVSLLALAVGLLTAMLAARAITRPIAQLSRLAQQHDLADPAGFVSRLPETDVVAGVLKRAVTDRQDVALALAESEQRFRTLFERSPSGTILLDPETARVLDCNEAAAGFVGCTIDEFRGTSIIEFSLQTSPERMREICRSVVSGQTWQYEARVKGRQGPRDLLVAIAPVQVSHRTLMLITQIDITDLHNVQADLRVNQERLDLARQGANLGIWDWDVVQDKLTWSDHQWRLHGLEPRPEGVKPEDWERVVHPADLPHTRAELRAALETATYSYATEYTAIMPDGSFRRLLGRGQTIRNVDGQAVRMVGICMDVTARYEAEMARDRLICVLETERSRLSDIVKALPIGVGIIDAAGRVVLGNGITNRLVGSVIPSLDPARRDAWIAFHTDGSRVASRRFPGALALQGETTLPGREFLFNEGDGTKTWIRIGATPLRWEDGQVQEALIVLSDIDAEKRLLDIQQQANLHLEQRVQEEMAAREAAQQRAAHAERMYALGQIAGGIAHDFNNILQAVSGGAALIERRPGDPERVLRHARMVADAAKRGASITSRLLAFARRSELRAESIEALALLTDMAEVLTHTLGGSVVCKVEVAAELPRLFADRGQLETVLVNLATNARDAMPSGGILTMSANAERVLTGTPHPVGLAAGAYVRIEVKDTGLGMSRAVLARVTEPFFTTKEPGKGTGLGLAMAKGFAEQSGGSLSIESTEGQGTSIILWLPQDRADAVTASTPATTRVSELARPRILLVDDDMIVRQVLVLSLEDSGYAVLPAESGTLALALLDQGERVDIIVSDLTMPVMDGLALIHSAQERRPGLPAVLLTGYAADDAALAVGGAISGSFSLLRKPVSGMQLVDRITALLEGQKPMRPADDRRPSSLF